MGQYEVCITDTALSDMESIYDYISYSLQAPENAKGQYDRIANAILTLETFPKRFPLFGCEPEKTWGLRKMNVDNYLVCYIVDDDRVTVTDVLYGASDVKSRLEDRHS